MKKITLSILIVAIYFTTIKTNVLAQDIIIQQNTTGNSRSDIRGQAFVPSEFGDGVGNTFGQDTVYLNSFSINYVGDTVPDQLFIYEELPASTADLDSAVGGTMVGKSYSVYTVGGKATYQFGYLALGANTTYYAVFREDAQLLFGETADAAGPYAGGKMLYNDGSVVEENDSTALQFSANLYLTENIDQGDLEALIALYNATDGPNWEHKWNLNGDPKDWYGTTWSIDNRLSRLIVQYNNLNGSIPTEIRAWSRLIHLSLAGNNIEGEIPFEIGELSQLDTLRLRLNALSGNIPESLGNLVNLMYIDISNNLLVGSLPESINNLDQLVYFDIRYNKIESLPKLVLPSLIHFFVYSNKLQFDSFERNIDIINGESYNCVYLPQRDVVVEDQIFELDTTFTLTVAVGGDNNLYQWFKDGQALTEPIPNPDYQFNLTTTTDEGDYSCEITNTVITGTIETIQFTATYPIQFNTDPNAVEIKESLIQFSAIPNKNGTTYELALPAGDTVLTEEEVMERSDGFGFVSKDEEVLFDFDGLEPDSEYDFYFVIKDNLGLTSRLSKLTAKTENSIQFVENYPAIMAMDQHEITFKANLTRDGWLYYVVLSKNSPPPTAEEIKIHANDSSSFDWGYLEVTALSEIEVSLNSLPPNVDYNIFLVGEDEEMFYSEVVKLEASTVTGIEKSFFESNDLNIHPNPTCNQLKVDVKLNQHYDLNIIDSKGKSMYKKNNCSFTETIDVNNWPKGVYLLNLQIKNKSSWAKFIKE